MTFSFSAPRFTDADERYEQEHLTEEERLDAWRDVYGKTEPLEETPSMVQSAQALLEKELEQIPNKQAYLDAVAACPDVVRSESPAIRFMRCEKYNAAVSHVRLSNTEANLFSLVVSDLSSMPINSSLPNDLSSTGT